MMAIMSFVLRENAKIHASIYYPTPRVLYHEPMYKDGPSWKDAVRNVYREERLDIIQTNVAFLDP